MADDASSVRCRRDTAMCVMYVDAASSAVQCSDRNIQLSAAECRLDAESAGCVVNCHARHRSHRRHQRGKQDCKCDPMASVDRTPTRAQCETDRRVQTLLGQVGDPWARPNPRAGSPMAPFCRETRASDIIMDQEGDIIHHIDLEQEREGHHIDQDHRAGEGGYQKDRAAEQPESAMPSCWYLPAVGTAVCDCLPCNSIPSQSDRVPLAAAST